MQRNLWPVARPWIGTVARLVTGGVWIVAGALKLPDPVESAQAVRAYEILPETLVPTVGFLLPAIEVVVGICLVLGVLTRAGGLVSALLFAIFIAGIASAWARGLEIDCGCFGGGGEKEGASSEYPWEIARDVLLMLASLWLVRWPRTRLALDNLIFRPDGRDPGHDPELDVERNDDGEPPEEARSLEG
ncbi:DoxX family protein [Nocardioides campestrisoli]|uniref:DoxX family protein n=1 Tax=Nocardioides campestrisoli TaxID=2736757 RepID=UPI001CD4370C|nr:MauE/DoxX family redox-associated membrane protein [Nocardioides campestrisoli]